MDTLLISVFGTEEAAYDGLAALKDLHRDGTITLAGSTLVRKDEDGVAVIEHAPPPAPRGTLVGAVAGALVGLLGGPAGVAVGMFAGAGGGLLVDHVRAGTTLDFVDAASRALEPGGAAIVAELDHDSVAAVDARLAALGGTTFRRAYGDWPADEAPGARETATNPVQQAERHSSALRVEDHRVHDAEALLP